MHSFDLVRVDARRNEIVFDADSAAGSGAALRELACAAHFSPVPPRVAVVVQSRSEALHWLSPLYDMSLWDPSGPGPAAAREALASLLRQTEEEARRGPPCGGGGGNGGRGPTDARDGGASSSSSSSMSDSEIGADPRTADWSADYCLPDRKEIEWAVRVTQEREYLAKCGALAQKGDFQALAAQIALFGGADGADGADGAGGEEAAEVAGGPRARRRNVGAWVLSPAMGALPHRLHMLGMHARMCPATWRTERHWEEARRDNAAEDAAGRPAGFELWKQPHWGDGMLKDAQGFSVGYDGERIDPGTGLPFGLTLEDMLGRSESEEGEERKAKFDGWWEESSEGESGEGSDGDETGEEEEDGEGDSGDGEGEESGRA